MSNELAPAGASALAALSNISDAITAAERALDVKDGGGAYLKFSKGLWLANGEDEVMDTDVWAMSPFTMFHGWVDFDDSGNAQEQSVPITEPCPDKAALPEPFETSENGWQKMFGIDMTCAEGDFKGETFTYKTNSYGGRKAMSDFLQQLMQKIATKDPNVVALVTLGKTSYKHNKYGMVFNPVFKYKRWANAEENEVEEAPAKKEAAAPETQEDLFENDAAAQTQAASEADEPAEEPPVRRRRRRA